MTAIETGDERRVILGLLIQQEGLYGRLASLAEEEHTAIVAGTPEVLEALLVEKEQLIQRILLLEAERLASVGRIAFGLGLREPTLSDLRDLWSPEELAQVEVVQASLQASIRRTADLNRRNASLLRASLLMLDRWMDLLTGGNAEPAYGRSGAVRRRDNPVAVNRVA